MRDRDSDLGWSLKGGIARFCFALDFPCPESILAKISARSPAKCASTRSQSAQGDSREHAVRVPRRRMMWLRKPAEQEVQ